MDDTWHRRSRYFSFFSCGTCHQCDPIQENPFSSSPFHGVCGTVKEYTSLGPAFFLYFGLPKAGIHISGETCAAAGLTFLGGSYMAEALRSGIESVSVSQYESAAALGLTEHQIFRFVVLPQAFTVSLPPLCANVLFLIKETSVFSVCAVPDLMYIAKDLIGLYYKTDETLWMLVISYLIILLPISAGASLLERRLRHGPYRDTDPA